MVSWDDDPDTVVQLQRAPEPTEASRSVYDEMADDYGTLTAHDFDRKYPGWAGSYSTVHALREAFDRRRAREGSDE